MITVDFSNGYDSVTAPGLYQWDKGRTLEIRGLSLQTTEQVHFANRESSAAIIHVAYKQSDGSSKVDIPNSLLESSLDIYAYIYVATGENGGKTIKTIKIPVNSRPKPGDFVAGDDSAEAAFLETALMAINGIAGDVEEFAESIPLNLVMVPEFNKTYEQIKADYEANKAEKDEDKKDSVYTTDVAYSLWYTNFNKRPAVGDLFVATGKSSGDGCVFGFKGRIAKVSGDTNWIAFDDLVLYHDTTIDGKIKIGDTYYSIATTTDESSTGEDGVITFVLEL